MPSEDEKPGPPGQTPGPGDARPRVWGWGELFLVGLSAGVISVTFPPIVGALTSPVEGTLGLLSNNIYLTAGVLLALTVGVAMAWMNLGRTETARNLFMSALALPAVLSGGINVAHVNATSAQNATKAEENKVLADRFRNAAVSADEQATKVINQLTNTNGVVTYDNLPGLKLPSPDGTPISAVVPDLAGQGVGLARLLSPREAHAAGETFVVPAQATVPLNDQRYITVLKQADSPAPLEELKAQIEAAGGASAGLRIVDDGNTYTLIDQTPKLKADALIDGLNLKQRVNGVQPGLYRVR
jgi:hypothetical protein